MRSPEHKNEPRTGRRYEEELSVKYLSPGAFTILSPQDYGVNPDPPSAPAQYRLTPNSSRRKIQAFSIIAEASSNPGSRSPSPSGRLSPFRGRGFNPAGSRHASPNPSPPPDDSRQSSASRTSLDSVRSPRRSQIPQLKTRGSTGNIFGEKVTQDASTPRNKNRSKLSPQLSQSLTNINSRYALSRSMKRKPAFEQLSPIAGSSPETGSINKSQSSPSKIPLSYRSQPSSRRSSPSGSRLPHNHQVSRQNSSRNISRNNSRDASPSKAYSRIPIAGTSSYKEVPPKVNTFNKSKPKVPPKPEELKSTTGSRSKLVKKSSETKLKNAVNGKETKSSGSTQNSNGKKGDSRNNSGKTNSNQGNNNNSTKNKNNGNAKLKKGDEIMVMEDVKTEKIEMSTKPELKTRESSTKLVDIPTATVVSSTTTTAVQPLQIEEDLENMLKEELSKVSGYTNDSRTLSATSVSSAMNKMNDTVLNSQTLLRDHNFPKLSPAASAIISLSNDNKALDTKSATNALPTIESIHKKIDGVGQNINNTFADSNKVYMESIENSVKNNMSKAITPDHVNTFVQKGAHEKLLDGRTLVAPDVKPIKILVKEKPSDIEVQSGNIRLPSSATNGLNSSPSLPPSQPETHESDHEEEERTSAKKNCCLRLFSRCKCKKPTCKKWKKKKSDSTTPIKKAKSSISCFSCRKKKSEQDKGSTSTAAVGEENNEKCGCWDRLKCCKSKKVADTAWCSREKKKDNWVEKRESVTTQENVQSNISCKKKCKNAFKSIFCCGLCCNKKKFDDDQAFRRESMISKKKSLTPQALPPPDTRPKIDISLVEHTSLMRGAIPILPVPIAWICLICNIFLPGIGTLLSGLFCLCLGKPRFSQNDGPKPRIGAFIIDLIIGCGQLFTVLFCLVGWGWSIWWGVIMLKVARKHKRIRLVEERAQAPPPALNHNSRDLERGS
nr:protein stum [Onthophagus taurus]XP_022918326.1 protein stum [Onthophagus taurus]